MLSGVPERGRHGSEAEIHYSIRSPSGSRWAWFGLENRESVYSPAPLSASRLRRPLPSLRSSPLRHFFENGRQNGAVEYCNGEAAFWYLCRWLCTSPTHEAATRFCAAWSWPGLASF